MSPEVVVAFRYHDVRELSVTRAAGNMPIEVLTGQSASRETSGSGEPRRASRPDSSARSSRCWRTRLSRIIRRCTSSRGGCSAGNSCATTCSACKPLAAADHLLAAGRVSRGRSEIDFGADVARPFVARFWGDVIGLTARGVRRGGQPHARPGPNLRLAAQSERLRDRRPRGRSLRRDRHALRRPRPGRRRQPFIEEMAADLAVIDVDGKPESLGSYVAANLFDGFHTVGVAVSNALYVLLATGRYDDMLRKPDTRAEGFRRVAADRAAAAADASLRAGRHRPRRHA